MRVYFCVLSLLFTTMASASDAYLVRFRASGNTQGCSQLVWRDNVLFYNQHDTPATVRLLGISNGPAPADAPATITLPPQEAVSLNDVTRSWEPAVAETGYKLWVLHLDIPAGVVVESRDEYSRINNCIALPQPPFALGKVSMPVFRALVPAGTSQVELGTDIGVQAARTNVGIYNAAAVPAIANITVRRTCDNAVVDSRVVSIPAQSVVQFGGFQKGGDIDAGCLFSSWARYVMVTVDEPSFMYVANVTEALVDTSGLTPTVGLAVAHNVTF